MAIMTLTCGTPAAASPSEEVDITVAGILIGKTLEGYGYYTGTTGATTPSPDNFSGHVIKRCFHDISPVRFVLRLGTASLGASFFLKFAVEDDSGFITMNAADATYSTGTGYSQWSWSSTYWTGDWSDDSGEVWRVRMIF